MLAKFRALKSGHLLDIAAQGNGSIIGSVKKLGSQYSNAKVYLLRRDVMNVVAVTIPENNGDYAFNNVSKDIKMVLLALDAKQEYNAVAQDQIIAQ